VLGSTPCSEGAAITQAIESLNSGGSTNGGGGIQMAYDLAQSNFIKEGINRVVMATDGDFNVGTTAHGDLMGLIEARAKSGVFLTTLGFGMGNLKDSTLEQLANRGNGNYAYIDNHAEARKALVDQLSGTLQTIAKDVKIQVEFNPAKVSHYRLLGYENRALANQDFNDDTKDAGEIGAGHTVTALYEIIPAGGTPVTGVDALKYQSTTPGDAPVDVQPGVPSVDALKYQTGVPAPGSDVVEPAKPGFGGEERFAPEPMPVPMPVPAGEWLTVKMRYKQPEGNESTKIDVPLLAMNGDLREVDADFRFASAVAAFGQVLRNSGYRHSTNFDRIIELARGAANGDADREAFVDLVITAKTLSTQNQ
jgi:Ca-activated chloride channel family protein